LVVEQFQVLPHVLAAKHFCQATAAESTAKAKTATERPRSAEASRTGTRTAAGPLLWLRLRVSVGNGERRATAGDKHQYQPDSRLHRPSLLFC
jgi:hypothetical protein